MVLDGLVHPLKHARSGHGFEKPLGRLRGYTDVNQTLTRHRG
jgi:hypothetical protein